MEYLIKRFSVAVGLFISTALYAEEENAMVEPLSVGSMLQVLAGLTAVLILFYGLVFVIKRMGGFSAGQGGKMRVIDGVSVGTRDRVLLVQVGEKQVLIGVSTSGISPITVFDQEVITAEEIAENGFAGQLQQQIKSRLNPQATQNQKSDQSNSSKPL
ncbi:MAG: flagellar biosynthetic protein FliO [Gammaproteobacteria bacterium]